LIIGFLGTAYVLSAKFSNSFLLYIPRALYFVSLEVLKSSFDVLTAALGQEFNVALVFARVNGDF
jgi:undecaprenyl pyrophosphate phosphatase UppP